MRLHVELTAVKASLGNRPQLIRALNFKRKVGELNGVRLSALHRNLGGGNSVAGEPRTRAGPVLRDRPTSKN